MSAVEPSVVSQPLSSAEQAFDWDQFILLTPLIFGAEAARTDPIVLSGRVVIAESSIVSQPSSADASKASPRANASRYCRLNRAFGVRVAGDD